MLQILSTWNASLEIADYATDGSVWVNIFHPFSFTLFPVIYQSYDEGVYRSYEDVKYIAWGYINEL